MVPLKEEINHHYLFEYTLWTLNNLNCCHFWCSSFTDTAKYDSSKNVYRYIFVSGSLLCWPDLNAPMHPFFMVGSLVANKLTSNKNAFELTKSAIPDENISPTTWRFHVCPKGPLLENPHQGHTPGSRRVVDWWFFGTGFMLLGSRLEIYQSINLDEIIGKYMWYRTFQKTQRYVCSLLDEVNLS